MVNVAPWIVGSPALPGAGGTMRSSPGAIWPFFVELRTFT
jgi:acyl CoA:acetate/3-ketoacid CoA transferase beta subunit